MDYPTIPLFVWRRRGSTFSISQISARFSLDPARRKATSVITDRGEYLPSGE